MADFGKFLGSDILIGQIEERQQEIERETQLRVEARLREIEQIDVPSDPQQGLPTLSEIEADIIRGQRQQRIQIPLSEEEKKEGSTFDKAISHLIDSENVPKFEDPERKFTESDIISEIRTNLDKSGDITSEGISKVDKIIRTQLKDAIESRDVTRIHGILSTLGSIARNLQGKFPDISQFFEEIIEQTIPITSIRSLRGRVQQPVDVPLLINNLFNVELQQLQKRNLGQEEVLAIRREFQNDLDNFEREIITQSESELKLREGESLRPVGRPEQSLPPLFGQNTFQKLSKYISDHVENDQLRLLLLNDIDNRIAQDRDKIGVRLGNAPQQIIPISATEIKIIREPLAQGIGTVLGESLVQLLEEEKGTLTLSGEINKRKTKRRSKLDENTRELVGNFNSFINTHQIKDPRTGLLQLIPLKKTVSFEDQETKETKERIEPIPTEDLIRELQGAQKKFSIRQQIFSRVPIRQRDFVSGQTRDTIIQDLVQLQKNEKLKDRRSKPMRHLASTMSRRSKMPGIEIKRGQRLPIKVGQDGMQKFTAHQREIKIMRGATLSELAKIANMIAMESGSLEDVRGQPLLNVEKGVTPIQEIVNVIMDVHKKHAGNDFSLIFVPNNVFGGQFLDGALANIHMNRMLVGPTGYGGGFNIGSVFKGIGNVVGSVASLPLNLIGSVFGGGLYRPADAPQHGGDLRDTFVEGEHQIEPHVAPSAGKNQIFRIQPFLGGRIDNTGFVDKSHVQYDKFGILPKHIWADIPVHSLTHFR